MEPPAKKIKPYVTKWERKKAEEDASKVNDLPNSENTDLKGLFITNETILEYQDKYYRNSLPR